MEKGFPAASKTPNSTGANLDKLLAILADKLERTDLIRENITITNAWPYVEYGKTSEAKISQVKKSWNLDRLKGQLAEVSEAVILSGNRSHAVHKHLLKNGGAMIICIPHLGARGLNSVKLDSSFQDTCKSDSTSVQRLRVLANKIISDLLR
jgi:hypothetical protein